MSRFKTLLSLSFRRQLIVVEAFVMILWAWFVVRCIGFPRYAKHLGKSIAGEYIDRHEQDAQKLRDVRWAVDAVNRVFGSRFTCLMQGTAAKLMFNRRKISNTLVLGTKISRNTAGEGPKNFEAHAWLYAGQAIVLGGEERHEYVAMASYFSDLAKKR